MTGMRDVSEEERLRAQIEHTRQELGETVEALAAKANVPARVKRRGAELGQQTQTKAQVMAKDAQAKAQIVAKDARAKAQVVAEDAQVKIREAQVKVQAAPTSWLVAAGGGLAAMVALIVFLRGRS